MTLIKSPNGSIQFSTRKSKASPHAVKAAATTSQLSSSKPRKNVRTVRNHTEKYRPDLTQVRFTSKPIQSH